MFKCQGILILLLFLFSTSVGAQTHVQTNTFYQTTTSNTISRAFAAASTTGNLIVVHLDWDNQTRAVLSVTDNKGNSYARINGPTNWNGTSFRAELWYAYNITGGGAPITVTAKLTGTPTSFFQIYTTEYSGIVTTDPLDQNSAAAGTAVTVSSGAQTTNYSNKLIYGASIGSNGSLFTGAGFTNRSSANSNIIEDKKAATSGSNAATFTSVPGNKWVAQMATFITTTSAIILPVTLSGFSGACSGDSGLLAWETTSETNNDYFLVQRSVDGNQWSEAGRVAAAGIPGNNNRYRFTAANPVAAFFRLQQTDRDGRKSYSHALLINACSVRPPGVTLFPNPSRGYSISLRSTAVQPGSLIDLVVYDNAGRIAGRFRSRVSDATFYFPSPLSPGVYHALVTAGGVSTFQHFIVR